jgi:ABC-type antimicrobial peptide transport system permease subunit
MSIVMRTELSPEVMANSLRKIVTSLDPTMPVDDIQVMQALIGDSLVARRSPALLAGIFASIALLLAAVGTYGVLAYAVGQRRREIGVRMALGALPSQILTQFLAMGTKLLVAGVIVGIAGAWAVGRAMQSILFGVETFNPAVIIVTGIVMGTVVLLASLRPSCQASLVSPNEALRDE